MSGAMLALQGAKDVTLKRLFQHPGLSCGWGTISQTAQCKEVKMQQESQQCCKENEPFRKAQHLGKQKLKQGLSEKS